MTLDKFDFGPKNEEEAEIFAEEELRVDVQVLIHATMLRKGISRLELARRMACMEDDIDRLFEDDLHLSLSNMADIFHHLGVELVLTVKDKC